MGITTIWPSFGKLSDEDKEEFKTLMKSQTEKNARALFLLGRGATRGEIEANRRIEELERQLEEKALERGNVTKFGK